MIKMKINRVDYKNNNIPILYDREIDEFAYEVLKDYEPKLLREPGMIEFEHFLESYLGMTLMFKDIYSNNPKQPIMAITVFRDGIVKVFDRENECIINLIVRANTVIIDNSLMKPEKYKVALFSGLHEGGHILIHPKVYTTFRAGQVCCRRENIENFESGILQRTPEQWLEHQADYFAAALAMPNSTFIPFVNQILRENGIFKRNIILGHDDDTDILIKDLMPQYISDVYGVSKQAALIKLKKNKFIVDDFLERGER